MEEHERIMAEFQAQREELRKAQLGGFATTEERNREIAAAYAMGENAPALAKRFAVSRQRIWQILEKQGVQAHYKLRPKADEILEYIAGEQATNLEQVAAAIRMPAHSIRTRLHGHPRWPDIRESMRVWRKEKNRRGLRGLVMQNYHKLKESLGRPASIKEMASVGIFTNTLYRLYGSKYVSKFREDVGEVS
jgi:hypothetical protein